MLMRIKYWQASLQPLLVWENMEHEERVKAFKAIIENLDKIPASEIRGLDFPESDGDPCPVCSGTDFDLVVGLNPKVVLKCKRCGFVKEVVPRVNNFHG